MLPNISHEQQLVIENLSNNNNVIVNSVAGSGKTTNILHIASKLPNKKILLLTYNARLKAETRNKIKENKLKNIEGHSYHSFGVKYFFDTCFTDTEIDIIIKQDLPCLKTFCYDIIILDEAQDISPLLFGLICKIFKDNNNPNVQICIFGDERQSIFDFNKADQRFITYAEKIFTFNQLEWKRCKLSQSFRCTNETCQFINNCLYKEDFIFSSKSGVKPRYIMCDTFGNNVIDTVEYYLARGYAPTEIFILSPSVKSDQSPVRQLENQIKQRLSHIPVFVPINDDAKLDNDVLEGKLVFSTFHQTKGLERKVVIIFNFDNSYFLYYKKDKDPTVCPNELYVAPTRALEHLVLLHHYQNDFLPFLCKEKIKEYCDFTEMKVRITKSSKDKFDTSVTDLVTHLPQNVLDECYQYLDVNTVREKNEMIDIPLKIKQSYENGTDGFESVSEITGIAIPSYYEFSMKGKMSIFPERSSRCLIQLDEEDMEPSDDIEDSIKLSTITPEQLLYLATKWSSKMTGLLYKFYQITNYTWLTKENLQKGIDRLKTLQISKNACFEVSFQLESEVELLNRKLIGVFDCIDVDNRVFEFKCVQQLTKEHCLQLATYMYMYEIQSSKKTLSHKKKDKKQDKKQNRRSYFLYNILTDELLEIRCTLYNLKQMIKCLVTHKYVNKKRVTDEIFLSDVIAIKQTIMS